jgi:hypothetical protein
LAEHLCKVLALKDPRGKPRLAGAPKALRVPKAKAYWRRLLTIGPRKQALRCLRCYTLR